MPKRNSGTSEPIGGTVVADGAIAGAGSGGEHSVADDLAAAGFTIIEPAAVGSGAGGDSGRGNDPAEQPAKRRGRKPGSRTASKTPPLDINGVEAILFSAHSILASIVKTPEIALEQVEARQMAEAIANVSRHYDIAATQKTLDWANLIMAAGMIYGTRLYAIRAKRVANKPTKPATNGATHIHGVGDVILTGEVPVQ